MRETNGKVAYMYTYSELINQWVNNQPTKTPILLYNRNISFISFTQKKQIRIIINILERNKITQKLAKKK